MRRVITYGTFDLLHRGHVALLERARALGDYLIVGVTSDQYDRSRGKLDVYQSTIERVDAVRATGLADLVLVEEYEGQKIEDIKRFDIDVFTVGSDWKGHFDYLSRFCDVIYLDRTRGVSSTQLRSATSPRVKIGVMGPQKLEKRFEREAACVGGIEFISRPDELDRAGLLEHCDALVVASSFLEKQQDIEECLSRGKHVLYVPPAFPGLDEWRRAIALAEDSGAVLFNGVKTKYFPAFRRLLLLVESGAIGTVRAVDLSCSQVPSKSNHGQEDGLSSAMEQWGGLAFLPIVELLGLAPESVSFRVFRDELGSAHYVRCGLEYAEASAHVTMGRGIKTEGDMVITGTKGYVYVPAPWWLTDYFEIRNEDLNGTRKFYWGYEGDGLRYELLEFVRAIRKLPSCWEFSHESDGFYPLMTQKYLAAEVGANVG